MKHSDILVITTFAPASLVEGSLRAQIFSLFIERLNILCSSKHIDALLIGPYHHWGKDYNFEHIVSDLPSKETKLASVHAVLSERNVRWNYVCRLDDDDFLNPHIHILLDGKADFFTDRYHTFFDIASGKLSKQIRPWFPNTTLMKWEHAFAEPWEAGKTLFFHYDHSQAWHKYAEEKDSNVYYAQEEPLYLRLLSPVSITSSGIRDGQPQATKVQWMEYFKYRKSFGSWMRPSAEISELFPIDELNSIWHAHDGKWIEPNAFQHFKLEMNLLIHRFKLLIKRFLV